MGYEVMLDLETLGTGNRAAIISVGAVKFDPLRDDLPWRNFKANVSMASAMRYGDVTPSTLEWWFGQSDVARLASLESPMELEDALAKFSDFFGPQSLLVWGNGATFDNVILRSAYVAVGLEPPWHFRHDRCHRTVRDMFKEVPYVKATLAHDALSDATAQAEHLSAIRKLVESRRAP